MTSGFGPLNGSGPQQIWLDFTYVSYDVVTNRSQWYYEVRYYGNGYGSWGTTIYWALSGFAIGGSSHYIPQSERYNTYTVLGSGVFDREHDAAGYLPAGNLRAAIDTDHSSIGDGAVEIWSGIPPRIPKLPGKPATPTFISSATTSITFGITNPADDGGSALIRFDLQAATDAAFTTIVDSWTDTNTPSTAEPLAPGNQHWIRYRAVNSVGGGPWSDALIATTLPATPPGLEVTPSLSGLTSSAALTPPSGASGVSKYTLERRALGTVAPVTVTESPTSPIVTTGLTPASSYEYRASAWFGSYQSPWTSWITVTQPNPNTNPGSFFDGSTADTPALDYGWTGAAGNSSSTATGLAPTGWRTFAQSAVTSSGTGAVFRATGGFQGSFAARAVFFTDTTAYGFAFGTADDLGSLADTEANALYFGSVYAYPSRTQRLRASIRWWTAAGVFISQSNGAEVVVTSVGDRLSVSGVAPANAQFASVVVQNVAGASGSLWLGGDWLQLDAAMISLQALFPYFDGATPNTAQYAFTWLGAPNASGSMRTTLDQSETDPLADPDCPPVPGAPKPPVIDTSCIDTVGTWRRYWAIIPESEVFEWLDVVPTITISTAGIAARQVRLRFYQNPDNLAPTDTIDLPIESEQIISYMPPNTVFTLDGVSESAWASVAGGDEVPADDKLYGADGLPATWPVLSCGDAYLISIDVPLDAPEGNIAVGAELTTRMM